MKISVMEMEQQPLVGVPQLAAAQKVSAIK